MDGKPEPQQDSLMTMMIPILGLVNSPSEEPAVKEVQFVSTRFRAYCVIPYY
jgi:hypothetical protein